MRMFLLQLWRKKCEEAPRRERNPLRELGDNGGSQLTVKGARSKNAQQEEEEQASHEESGK
ncbi:hypothetical protein INR49_017361 [Caranx melampygus]|nr:hypothetical protein INR49_017361 [Caranx melampygus]